MSEGAGSIPLQSWYVSMRLCACVCVFPTRCVPDSHHLDAQLLGALQQVSAVLQGTAQRDAHLPLAPPGRFCAHLQQQPWERTEDLKIQMQNHKS